SNPSAAPRAMPTTSVVSRARSVVSSMSPSMTWTADSPPTPRGRADAASAPSLGNNALSMTTRLRDTSALGVGAALSGVLAYVFFALVTQVLGPVRAAPV